MTKDFYLHERALASYVEKDWYDKIYESSKKTAFEFAPFSSAELYSDYHERLIEFLIAKSDLKPERMLEVGASLGRTFYEACGSYPTLKTATLIEPSQNLASTFKKIFTGEEVATLSILKGNSELIEVPLNTKKIKETCAAVCWDLINKPFQDVESGDFDLVICSNVLDQCKDHFQLIDFVKRQVAPNGILLLSCTYQWNAKYTGNASPPIKDINDLFESNWIYLGETNIPFRVRISERHWLMFLSHVVAYQAR